MGNRSMLPLLRMLEVGHGEVLLIWRHVCTCIYKERRAITEALNASLKYVVIPGKCPLANRAIYADPMTVFKCLGKSSLQPFIYKRRNNAKKGVRPFIQERRVN